MKYATLFILLFLGVPIVLTAHGIGSSGIVSGLTHPLVGLDHLFAILAVGLLASTLYDKVGKSLITIFVLAMLMGGISGIFNFSFSYMEVGIAISTIFFGIFILVSDKFKSSLITFFVGLFAWMHGLALGTEMDPDFHVVPYFVGFLVATLALLLIGRLAGRLIIKAKNQMALKILGCVFIVLGLYFLFK